MITEDYLRIYYTYIQFIVYYFFILVLFGLGLGLFLLINSWVGPFLFIAGIVIGIILYFIITYYSILIFIHGRLDNLFSHDSMLDGITLYHRAIPELIITIIGFAIWIYCVWLSGTFSYLYITQNIDLATFIHRVW